MKRKRIFVFLWIVTWIFYLGRGLIRGEWATYEKLFHLPSQDRMEALMDDPSFYRFLDLCRREIPKNATYNLLTPFEYDHLDVRRAHYLLYPAWLDEKEPDYLLRYKREEDPVPGYRLMRRFGSTGLILKKEIPAS